LAAMGESPSVSIILPVRNEARYIQRSLDAVAAQDYPHDKMQVLIVDGMSDDGTRELVLQWSERSIASTACPEPVEGFKRSNVELIDNPQRIVPTALNRGLGVAHGEIIIRVDGHAVIAKDYVRRCVEKLERVDADCVGGAIRTIGETWVAQAIAIAQSTPFGVGNAAFRYAEGGQYVDTLAFGAYRRRVFQRIGLFDEELVRNQDDEFNYRLIRSGGKIWLDPAIHSTYYSRASLTSLWRQYFGYGFWKVRVIRKHGRPASWRHLVPAAFVSALFLLAGISLVSGSPLWFIVIALPYGLATCGVTLALAARKGWRYAPLLPLVFLTMHFAYGTGFLFGLAQFFNGGPPFPLWSRREWMK
jgi:cellulose synthase/poly-beta-1,6-N-acetylglucosamine synthase-like glycosyltransferase